MTRISALCVVLAVVGAGQAFAQDLPPLEAYGKLPDFSMLELSPSGRYVASRIRSTGQDLVMVFDLESLEYRTGLDAEEVNPRSLSFVGDDVLVLVSGETIKTFAVRNAFDYSAAHSLDIHTGEGRVLLSGGRDLYPYQSGLGQIIGVIPGTRYVLMPAYIGEAGSDPTFGIFRVDLIKGRERIVARGRHNTVDWFLSAEGKPLVREDFDDHRNIHRIWRVNERGYNEELLYEEESKLREFGTVGITAARDALVLMQINSTTGVSSVYLMSLETGAITGPVLNKPGKGIERVITDINRVVVGVEYNGFKPSYAFFDPQVDQRVQHIMARMENTSARLVGWSDDFAKLAFKVEGGFTSGVYLIFTAGNSQPQVFGSYRPGIDSEHVATVEIATYEAGDGLTIPALVTARDDVRAKGDAPLLVLPHGGPQAFDRYGFDWLAQYFASRGYVVLQPQFRGSDGFGYDHLVAGHGEFGRRMSTDLDDGVRFLVQRELVNPDRVCIMGGSYGGYAALAAGAFSPDMYRCIVSFNGVSDLNRKTARMRSQRGKRDSSLDYWAEYYGSGAFDRDALRAISPSEHADAFKAPVLLLHGVQDTVVNIEQSRIMEKALRKAGKDVTFVKLKGEDHWLTQEETRIEMLKAAAAFIEEHL